MIFDEMMIFEKKNPLYGKHGRNMRKQMAKEIISEEADIDLPGFKRRYQYQL